ncbi:restriction endonuclease subunit S [Shewanella chilikensis]|uniref:restriction endonuclease subunit S n=1 Tax=Shewanella chilikensis TaxID=558541 RepID=UPI00399A6E02
MSEQATLNNKYVGYADYKDSRVEELGRLPATWGVKKVNYLFSFGRGLNITKANLEDTGIPVVNYGEVHSKYGFVVDPVIHPLKCVSSEYLKTNPGALLRRGDFVFADTSEDLEGAGNFTHFDGSCDLFAGYHTVVLRPQHDNLPRFLAYAFDSLECRSQVKLAVKGVKVFSVTQGILKDVALPVPPIEEQRTIAAFLDYETARIDSLIAKQQRLIELLKEKRQAVISHAVTKGLNPDAPMKDSGVEWLGQVPEHWVVSRIKNYAKIDSGHTPSRQVEEYWIDCNIPWVSLNDSKTLKIVDYLTDTKHKISELGMSNSSAHLLPAHSVVFTRDASIGLSAILDKPMAVSQHLIAWICDHTRLLPEFLLLAFYAMEKEFERYTFGATIKTIGMDDVRSLTAAFPPLTEQSTIAKWAFEKMSSLDKGIVKAESVVGILRERRTALISAAVTGKIDLRGWTPPREG